MAVQSEQSADYNSPKQPVKTYTSGPLKIIPFDFKKIDLTTASHLMQKIAKKPTGKSWVVKDILYHNNLSNVNNIAKSEEMDELASLINTKLHL